MPLPEPSNSILPPSTRHFGDVGALRDNIFQQSQRSVIEVAPFEPQFTRESVFDSVANHARNIKPIQNDLYTLSLADVGYEGPERFSKKDHKQAVLSHGSLARKLRGTWNLTDNGTGKTIAQKRTTLANVPYMTDAGTFVHNGVEYTLSHQMRLRPGVYTREKDNGELEAHVNVLPGKGRMHRYFLDPKTGVFKINIGQAQIPLMPLLKAVGIPDPEIRKAWGNELYAVNAEKGDAGTVDKLYSRLVYKPDPNLDGAGKQKAIAEEFSKMELDPEVTKRTLGESIKNLTPDAIIKITKKLIAVNRKEAESDDRDSMAFQQVLGPEDLIGERFTKDKAMLRQLLWKATAKKSLDHVPTGAFNKAIVAALIGSGLGSSLEEINPTEIFDHQARVTRLGEGGIGSLDAVPQESRNVQPSHFGFVDYLRSPESAKVGVDMRFAHGALKGSDGKLYMQVKNIKTGKMEYKSPQDIADTPLVFPGEDESDLPAVAAIVNGKMKYIPKEQAQYMLPDMDSSFSTLSNMVPMKSLMKGHRVIMGSRMFTQALPLVNAEAPLIQSATAGDPTRSYEDIMGQSMGATRADELSQVVSVTPDEIVLRNKDGEKKTVELYNNAPFNRKTSWTQTALVQPGDTVKPGQLLAQSNFTDKNGSAALGLNLRVGYLPFRGAVFDDSVVLSESAAKRLTSEHMYQHEAEADDSTHIDKKKFISLFPGEYDKKVLDNFDNTGAVKAGTVVNYGDPILLVSKARETTYGQVFRGKAANFTNDSITWEHHAPGVVTDVTKTKKGYSVVVKSQATMEVGDKLSGRFGDKGVVADIVPDEQMPQDAKGRALEVLVSPLGLASRINPAQLIEAALGKVAEKTGTPYKLKDFDSTRDLLQFAKDELRKNQLTDLEDVTDPETGRKIKGVMTGNRFFMKLHHTSESKAQGRSTGGYTAEGAPAKGGVEGAKRVGMLDLGALLSHGAGQVIRDAKMVRGQANPEYWSQVMAGYTPPLPKIPRVY
jgi:DNA-directed RNA polymerase subunit beta